MKRIGNNILLLLFALLIAQCTTEPTGFNVTGTVEGIKDNSIFFESAPFNGPIESLVKSDLNEDGTFTLTLDENPGAGIYRIRTGGKQSRLILDGTENKLKVNANADQFAKNTFEISGSESAEAYNQVMRDQYANKMNMEKIQDFLKTTKNPYGAQSYADMFLKSRPEFAVHHEGVLNRLEAEYPDHEQRFYASYIQQLNQKFQARKRSEKIKVGQPAPDITMPDINGKKRSLSDLKGKIVLLDFWASWCGPCRRANPHVVEVYKKYKDQGFDVFSVSLDGLDQKSKQRFKLDDAAYDKKIEDSKKRWLAAIDKDKLTWDNHVSELTKWDSPSARKYGVTGIPKTFLIDRDGNIAAVNPRFDLEKKLKEIL